MEPLRRGIVVHGGAGAPPALSDGCAKAAQLGWEALSAGSGALDAAIAAVVSLEDDGRFNAGSGSILRLDGKSVEMDASVMDSTGLLGAVAGISEVKNPVLVARRVAETPHVLLSGQGAVAFARRCGFEEYRQVSQRARERHRALIRALRERRFAGLPPRWPEFDLERYWNLEPSFDEVFRAADTVGAVAVSDDGVFAVASSTGGSSPMLRGRIGDTPLIGCGFYAGEGGAVAATGFGEEIIRRMLAREVYQAMAAGAEPRAACEAGLRSFPAGVSVGAIAIGRKGHGVASNVPMAWHAVLE